MMRDFVEKICLHEPGFEVVARAATGREAVEGITRSCPEIIVMDLGLPDIDGIEVLARIRGNGVRPRVLILSSFCSPYVVFRLEKAAVQGFVDKKEHTADTLRQAIRSIGSNQTYFSKSYLEIRRTSRLNPLSFDKLLTNQQILVLSMVADLYGDEAIASRLEITERTVEAHRTAIMRKLGVHSRTELMRFAVAEGFSSWLSKPAALGDSAPDG